MNAKLALNLFQLLNTSEGMKEHTQVKNYFNVKYAESLSPEMRISKSIKSFTRGEPPCNLPNKYSCNF